MFWLRNKKVIFGTHSDLGIFYFFVAGQTGWKDNQMIQEQHLIGKALKVSILIKINTLYMQLSLISNYFNVSKIMNFIDKDQSEPTFWGVIEIYVCFEYHNTLLAN